MAFASGLNAGLGLGRQRIAKRQNELTAQDQEATRRQEVADNLNQQINTALEVAGKARTNADKSGAPAEKTSQAVKPLIDRALSASRRAQKLGIQGVVTPDVVQARAKNITELAPTREQELQNEAEKTRTLTTAKEEAKVAAQPQTGSIVVGGDSQLGQNLGIPPGGNARVEFDVGPDGQRSNPRVAGSFGGGDTNVNVNTAQNEFTQAVSEGQAGRLNQIIDTGRKALGTEQNLRQMAELLNNPELKTGALESGVTGLQSLASGFDVDLESAANSIGIEIGSLEKKEQFDRLAKRVIIDGFEKFKGNLNSREVRIAEDAFANLGRSEEANRDAVAAGLAAQQIARERAVDATSITSPSEQRALERKMLSEDSERFTELKEQFKSELGGTEETTEPLPEGIPQGSEQVDSLDGKPVFKTPDGKFMVVE